MSKSLFESKFLVAFHLADPAGILFFGNFFSVVHQHYETWAKAQLEGQGWAEWFSAHQYGYYLRHVEADYRQPLKVGQEYLIRTAVESSSDHSWVFQNEFVSFQEPQGEPLAVVRTVHVCVDIKTGRKAPVPPKMKKMLQLN
jgi:acyl-CoA thioesterase FadM